jgi:hypothetical protein
MGLGASFELNSSYVEYAVFTWNTTLKLHLEIGQLRINREEIK